MKIFRTNWNSDLHAGVSSEYGIQTHYVVFLSHVLRYVLFYGLSGGGGDFIVGSNSKQILHIHKEFDIGLIK